MPASTPAPRPRSDAPARSDAARPSSRGARSSRPGRSRRIRWGRIPGRVILAVCFALGALALGAAVIPFTSTTDDGVELHCGPAVFEALMPVDPAFDDTPENVGCAEPAKTRLMIAGGVLVGAVLVAGITERRTRRGSAQRDARWLASSSAKASRRREERRSPARSAAPPDAVDRTGSPTRSLPTSRS